MSKHPNQRFSCCRALVDHLVDSVLRPQDRHVAAPFALERRTGFTADAIDDTAHLTDRVLPAAAQFLPFPCDVTVLPPLDPPSQASSEVGAALQPTLVIGLGGTATRLLSEIRERLIERFGALSRLPSIRFLAIDTDEQQLSVNAQGQPMTWGIGESVLASLRAANDYREQRDSILEWLSRRWLFNIPRSLRTEGMRPLGRLAVVGQFQDIRRAVAEALVAMRDAEAMQVTQSTTGIEVRGDSPSVMVIGNLSGGTAGGGLLDLAYAVRHELSKQELPDHDVRLLMLHSTSRRSSARDLGIANSITALRELSDYLRPQGLYPGEPTCGIPAFEHERARFAESRFLHLGDDLDDHEFAERLRQLGDYLTRELVSPCRGALRSLVSSGEQTGDAVHIETLGCMSLESLLGRLPGQVASHVARMTLENWLSPLALAGEGKQVRLADLDGVLAAEQTLEHDRHLETLAQQVARALKLEREPLEQLIRGLAEAALGEPPDAYWGKLLDRVLDPATGLSHGIEVDFAIRKVVGRPDALDQQSTYVPLRLQIEQRSQEIGRQLTKSVHDCLTQILDSRGTRIFTAMGVLDSLRARLSGMADILRGEAAALDLPLTQLAVMAVDDQPAPSSKGRIDVPQFRRRIWLEYARMQEQWALYCGTESVVRFTLRGLSELNEQLLELGRRIRSLRPEAFAFEVHEEQTPEHQQMVVWAKTQVRSWVRELDVQLAERLTSQGLSLSELRNPNHAGWERFGEVLRDAAQRIVVSASIQRSLRANSATTDSQASHGMLIQWLRDAQPRMSE
ncbi:MAG TPA: tubulin-like doman-containing protein, partial [Pirellulaceae bacterium]